MQVRAAAARSSDDWELVLLQSIGSALQQSHPPVPGLGCVALGHGGPGGVGDGLGAMVLTPADAPIFQDGWVLALACNTAPQFVQALVAGGVGRAGGYTEALRLPKDVDAFVPLLAQYIHQITTAIATEPTKDDQERRLYRALMETLDLLGNTDRFMLLGFVEQLRERLLIEP